MSVEYFGLANAHVTRIGNVRSLAMCGYVVQIEKHSSSCISMQIVGPMSARGERFRRVGMVFPSG